MKTRDHDKKNQYISIIGSVSLKMNLDTMDKKQTHDFKLLSLNLNIITQVLRMQEVYRMFFKCTEVLVNFYKMCVRMKLNTQ